MARKIRATVECGLQDFEEFYDLPDGWDGWSKKEQNDYLAETAVTMQNNIAPCGADVVEVED